MKKMFFGLVILASSLMNPIKALLSECLEIPKFVIKYTFACKDGYRWKFTEGDPSKKGIAECIKPPDEIRDEDRDKERYNDYINAKVGLYRQKMDSVMDVPPGFKIVVNYKCFVRRNICVSPSHPLYNNPQNPRGVRI